MGSRKNSGQKKNVAGSKSDITLIMESGTQSLSEAQLAAKSKLEEEYNQFMKKFSESLSKKNAEIIEEGSYITVYEIDCTPNFPVPDISNVATSNSGIMKPAPTSALLATSQSNVSPLIPNSSVLLPSANVASSGTTVFTGQPTTYQLVMGPRMGLLVTPSTPAAVSTMATPTNVSSTSALTTARSTTVPRVQVRPGLSGVVTQPAKRSTPISGPVPTPKISVNPATQKNNVALSKGTLPSNATSTVNTRSKNKLNSRQLETNSPVPTHQTTTYAKSTSNTSTVVDLTDDDGRPAADSREVSFNRFPGKMYPSLVVVARPHLKAKEMTASVITSERTQLDTKVKGILTNSPTKFTEWLIQQGLVRSEQVCNLHVNVDMSPIKLKLGMYSDVSKFPYSGGYVWISDCCPQKFVSVFCNSIFEGAPHAPTVLLKLVYHWACQTNVHNIISWVKVENLYIKNFFTNLRAICTAAICEKFGKLGGSGKKIEVGVISLGTTSQNGSIRQVKVEVLGIMDPITKYVRLRAVDPVLNAEKNHKLRFSRILESLEHWVHKSTTIITDYTVDKSTLNDLGFHSVVQVQLNSSQNKENNQGIMEYLKRVVPRMFQNTLSLLSRSIIQQFLDELVWRERWGPISSRAFDNLIQHLSEMTKLDTGDTLINRLKSITSNPFRDWCYKNWKNGTLSHSKRAEAGDTEKSTGTQKSTAVRSKSAAALANTTKASGQGTSKSSAKTTSTIMLTIDDSSDDASNALSVTENLEAEDDNVSVSSNSSSRRSRNRGVTIDENKAGTNGALKTSSDNQSVLKSLESFYYGVLPSDKVVVNKLKKVDLNMKCFVCGLTYGNNIQFMKHLAGHAQNEGAFTTDFQCRYCLKNFSTAYDLEDHLGSIHFPNKYNSMCLICGERFKYRAGLITHMQNMHVELELPYNCTICKFRSSEHTKVIDHFYEVHDGGEKVQCPFCLKIVAFESGSKMKLTQNVNFFFNHIKRHQQKRKCPKCVLSFVNKTYLKEHLTKSHNSCIALPGIIRHQCTDMSITLMPMPLLTPTLNRKGKPLPLSIPNFSTYKLETNLSYPDVPPAKCIECKSMVSFDQHFTAYFTCMKCMFASCCKTIMNKHIEKLHESKSKRRLPPRKTIPLQKPLYCVCGYSSLCGNNMASHLVHCKRRVAYPNPERAAQYSVQMQSASFPALVNLEDVEQDTNDASDKWLRAFVRNSSTSDAEDNKSKRMAISEKSPPRMLKELGLVRKESNSADGDDVAVKSPSLDDVDADKSITVPMETDDEQEQQLTVNPIKKTENEDSDESDEAEHDSETQETEDNDNSSDRNAIRNLQVTNTEDTEQEPRKSSDMTTLSGENEDTSVECNEAEYTQGVTAEHELRTVNGTSISNEKYNTASPVVTEAETETNRIGEKDQIEVTTENEPVTREVHKEKVDCKIVLKKDNIDQLKRIPEAIFEKENSGISVCVESNERLKPESKDVSKQEQEMLEESAKMETEDQSPVNERMDDAEENSVAMDCEENVDEPNKMLVDTDSIQDSVQDAMVVD